MQCIYYVRTINIPRFSRLRMVTFSVNTYVLNCCARKTVANTRNIYWMYEESTDRKICVRNFENMFESRLIGSRPMYRDDVLFIGNVGMLAANLKVRKIISFLHLFFLRFFNFYLFLLLISSNFFFFSFSALFFFNFLFFPHHNSPIVFALLTVYFYSSRSRTLSLANSLRLLLIWVLLLRLKV